MLRVLELSRTFDLPLQHLLSWLLTKKWSDQVGAQKTAKRTRTVFSDYSVNVLCFDRVHDPIRDTRHGMAVPKNGDGRIVCEKG